MHAVNDVLEHDLNINWQGILVGFRYLESCFLDVVLLQVDARNPDSGLIKWGWTF